MGHTAPEHPLRQTSCTELSLAARRAKLAAGWTIGLQLSFASFPAGIFESASFGRYLSCPEDIYHALLRRTSGILRDQSTLDSFREFAAGPQKVTPFAAYLIGMPVAIRSGEEALRLTRRPASSRGAEVYHVALSVPSIRAANSTYSWQPLPQRLAISSSSSFARSSRPALT